MRRRERSEEVIVVVKRIEDLRVEISHAHTVFFAHFVHDDQENRTRLLPYVPFLLRSWLFYIK